MVPGSPLAGALCHFIDKLAHGRPDSRTQQPPESVPDAFLTATPTKKTPEVSVGPFMRQQDGCDAKSSL